MAKRTKADKTKLALRRLVEDDEVQAHLRLAARRLREAWGRAAAARPRSNAVEDKKLYGKLRVAAISLTKAARALGRPPEPPKRRGRKLALLTVGAGGVAYAVRKRGAGSDGLEPSQPVATAATPQSQEVQTIAGAAG